MGFPVEIKFSGGYDVAKIGSVGTRQYDSEWYSICLCVIILSLSDYAKKCSLEIRPEEGLGLFPAFARGR